MSRFEKAGELFVQRTFTIPGRKPRYAFLGVSRVRKENVLPGTPRLARPKVHPDDFQ